MGIAPMSVLVLAATIAAGATQPAPRPHSKWLSWSGGYATGFIGPTFGQSMATTSTTFTPTGYFVPSSVSAVNTAGIQILDQTKLLIGGGFGFNMQSQTFVASVEADAEAMPLNSTLATTTRYPCCAPATFTITQTISTTYLITARGRAGFSAGPVLLYGTVGLATTRIDYDEFFTDTLAGAREQAAVSDRRYAFAYGGGLEIRAGRHASVRGEFLRTDFGTVIAPGSTFTTTTPPFAHPTTTLSHSATLAVNVVRVGVSVLF
jgi:outer membrane immunogenic protein